MVPALVILVRLFTTFDETVLNLIKKLGFIGFSYHDMKGNIKEKTIKLSNRILFSGIHRLFLFFVT